MNEISEVPSSEGPEKVQDHQGPTPVVLRLKTVVGVHRTRRGRKEKEKRRFL